MSLRLRCPQLIRLNNLMNSPNFDFKNPDDDNNLMLRTRAENLVRCLTNKGIPSWFDIWYF